MNNKNISTGFIDLDKCFGGIRTGDLVVIASRPGMGKSMILSNIFANNIIESKAKNFSIHCAYFSFEDNIGQVWENVANRICKFDFKQSTFNKDELYSEEKKNNAFKMLDSLLQKHQISLYENGGPDATFFYIALNAAEHKYKYGLDVIFIDSFHMLSIYDGSGKNIIANRLKQLAEKLDVAIIITAPIERPKRDGYCLENMNLQLVRMADKIIILRRLDVTATDVELLRGNIKKGDSTLTVMKNLNGSYGYARISFDYGNGGFFDRQKENDD